MTNLLIKSKLYIMISLFLVGLVIVGIVGNNTAHTIDNADTYLYEKNTVSIATLSDFSSDFKDVRIAYYQAAVNAISLTDYKTKANEFFSKHFDTFNTEYAKSYSDDNSKKSHETLKELVLKYKNAYEIFIQLKESGKQEEIVKAHLTSTFAPAGKAVGEAIEKMVDTNVKLAKETSDNNSKTAQNGTITLLIIVLAMATIVIVLGLTISRSITQALHSLKNGFITLNQSNDSSLRLTIQTKDETGEIAQLFNDYMVKLSLVADKDAQTIKAIEEIASQTSLGFVSVRIHAEAGSEGLKNAVKAINTMLEELEGALSRTNAVLTSYARADYTTTIEIGRYSGEVGGMLMALKGMGESVGDFMALIAKNGSTMAERSDTLSVASENLSTAANQQASSLEETAAAVEELTSNIGANTQKASEMAYVAKDAQHAVNNGKALADNTVIAMEEITKATLAINEAVQIIDNIAFQTNILSLNAAVEAATAGEAGKGFAVVAQEVRNLANRSAEAAKQIKVLAELANGKSSEGYSISQEMIKGFEDIGKKITQTTNLVSDVANASREQMAGIEQINGAITQLDQMTQQNARSASDVSALAVDILTMAQTLSETAAKTKYLSESSHRVCRVDMMFETNKLKLDHVNFKNNNFGKLKEAKVTAWTVTNETQCDLGKWIEAHRHEHYAKGSDWQELLKVHAHVHQKVQEYINKKALNASQEELKKIAIEIEHDTASVFAALNRVRAKACENILTLD